MKRSDERKDQDARRDETDVVVPFQPDQLKVLDEWRLGQSDHPSRPEAVRRILAIAMRPKEI